MTATEDRHGNLDESTTPEGGPRSLIPVALSSASVYPLSVHDAFAVARDLGYDGVEVMVTNNSISQDPAQLRRLSDRYGQPIVSIHAPTLLLTQNVWGKAWNKVENSCLMAKRVGCDVVVVHPPFRWQNDYAEDFISGVARLEDLYELKIAVENMYPWRVRGREALMYLPHWNPAGHGYRHITWDLSHAATAGMDSLTEITALGDSLTHLHLTDGSGQGGTKDEHLVPGEGNQRAAEVLAFLAASGFSGTVVAEIGTRKAKVAGEREDMLAHTLAFAREHLGYPAHVPERD